MSIYKDFNEIEMDLTECKDIPLTKNEVQKIRNRALKQLPKKRRNIGRSVAAVAILAIGLITFNHQSIANMPLIAGLLESWNHPNEVDWEPYKNPIGQTMTTEFGDLTLNEIIVDYDKVLISSTLELAKGSTFSYRHQLSPTIKINGQTVEVRGGNAQSIKQNNGMYLIYNEVRLASPVEGDIMAIQLSYDRMFTPSGEHPLGKLVSEPWNFEVTASQLAVQQQTIIKELGQHVAFPNGQSIVIDRIVTTPISTTVYFSSSTPDEFVNIALVNEDGTVFTLQSGQMDDNGKGIINFSGTSFVDQSVYIQLYDYDQPISERIFITDMQQ
ncbi:DUF4179 domain-containing protein [Solibacillus sp. FSL K6-1523]|uniref:DUF4179 domain-containing protein n=1 Tax=Solibacillus sp. FSL K6-1523 TaxID=2921471 RepID=UPI0030F99E2E